MSPARRSARTGSRSTPTRAGPVRAAHRCRTPSPAPTSSIGPGGRDPVEPLGAADRAARAARRRRAPEKRARRRPVPRRRRRHQLGVGRPWRRGGRPEMRAAQPAARRSAPSSGPWHHAQAGGALAPARPSDSRTGEDTATSYEATGRSEPHALYAPGPCRLARPPLPRRCGVRARRAAARAVRAPPRPASRAVAAAPLGVAAAVAEALLLGLVGWGTSPVALTLAAILTSRRLSARSRRRPSTACATSSSAGGPAWTASGA